jgi:hypothetical protein
MDVIGFLGLCALFMAHITGNLVVLAARSVRRRRCICGALAVGADIRLWSLALPTGLGLGTLVITNT